jgi:hypothetical protein
LGRQHLSDALSTADWVVANLHVDGILAYEGTGDGAVFKPIRLGAAARLTA